ncbi:hypothetical protein D3C78_1939620 [compost metagenome]
MNARNQPAIYKRNLLLHDQHLIVPLHQQGVLDSPNPMIAKIDTVILSNKDQLILLTQI